jgi:hypothetical protein
MPSFSAPRCRHIKTNGTQCGSPALRNQNFCFYHHQDRPFKVPCYYKQEYPLGELDLPYFEDAHSVQTVIRQVVQMVMQKRLERETASLLLYALQIASSNLKRIALETPPPEQVVTDLVQDQKSVALIAAPPEDETAREISDRGSDKNSDEEINRNESEQELPPGTIHACFRPRSASGHQPRPLHREFNDATRNRRSCPVLRNRDAAPRAPDHPN